MLINRNTGTISHIFVSNECEKWRKREGERERGREGERANDN